MAAYIEPAPYGMPPVGLDLGIAQLATLSDGIVIPNPRFTAKHHKKLKRLQQNLSRKKKGSANRKKGLNRSLGEAAFGDFRSMLEYKGKIYGCTIKAFPAAYTSQRCSACKHVDKANQKSQSAFVCTSCGFEVNADLNAAINILNSV